MFPTPIGWEYNETKKDDVEIPSDMAQESVQDDADSNDASPVFHLLENNTGEIEGALEDGQTLDANKIHMPVFHWT